jgi:hypothetical protein
MPNKGYGSVAEKKTSRGIKQMKAKDRVTLFVCTNGEVSNKIPLSIIGSLRKGAKVFQEQGGSTYEFLPE